ncbi:MAG: nucleotidyltransferase domain-containing protein [Candidatus Bipolaricaulota bacterium]
MASNGGSQEETRDELLSRELDRLLEHLLAQGEPPERVILFGSFAQGIQKEWADLDVVVIQPTELPFIQRTRKLLEDFEPEVALDVLVYTPEEFAELSNTRPFFRDEILAKGKVLYERG